METNKIEAIDENLIDLQLQEMALNLARRKMQWNASRSILAPITNALVKLKIEPRIDDAGDYNIYCTGDKQLLIKVMRILMTSGFRTDNDKPQAGQSSWSAWFESKECKMRVWFNFTSSVCKRVQVGTKKETYEVPIYETVCGESLGDETTLLPGEAPASIEHDDAILTNSGGESEGVSDQP